MSIRRQFTIHLTKYTCIDQSNSDSFICYACKNGSAEICDVSRNKTQLTDGELVLCSADADKIGVKTADCTLIEIKHKLIL